MELFSEFASSIGTTPSTILIGLALLVVCALIVRSEIKNHKNGGSCSGCAGGCSSGSCPSCSIDVDELEAAVREAEQRQN